MLVLSRQRDESVVINENIEIRVVDVRGEKVRLGFVAPRSVSIHRKEIYDAIRLANEASANLQPGDVPMMSGPRAVESAVVVASPAHEPMLELAVNEAIASRDAGGLASGCVVASGVDVLAKGRSAGPSTMGQAAMDACRQLHGASNATAYVTRPPTPAGAAALAESGVRHVIVGAGAISAAVRDLITRLGVTLVERNDPRCLALLSE